MSDTSLSIVEQQVSLLGYLKTIKKSSDTLNPLYEAISNSWESFSPNDTNMKIEVSFEGNSSSSYSISISDNGNGFTEESYNRFIALNDDSKGVLNKGTGRLQFLLFFNRVSIESIYYENGSMLCRKLEFSAEDSFIRNGSFTKATTPVSVQGQKKKTTVKLVGFRTVADYNAFKKMSFDQIKTSIIKHFILKGSVSKPVPTIYLNDINSSLNEVVSANSFPSQDKEFQIEVSLWDSLRDKSNSFSSIVVHAYKVDKSLISGNSINVASKGEVVSSIDLSCMEKNALFENKFFLFIVEGDYIDKNISENRNCFLIPRQSNEPELFDVWPNIVYEDLSISVNNAITENYPEIATKKQEHVALVNKIRTTFGIDESIIDGAKINVNDSQFKILEKVYKKESEKQAQQDSILLDSKNELASLDTRRKDYQEKLKLLVDKVNSCIPMQNKNSLSKYLARRKIVLEVFKSILEKNLVCQHFGRNEEEKLLHDLIFPQKGTSPSESNLWLLDDSYIYFEGCSDIPLKDVKVGERLLFKSKIAMVEDEYFKCRSIRRPDILLFPTEGKCIIIY